ncbi:hypothetical protein OAV62_01925 [bacterium]|nr:hypothetical protein [bacterium]
MSSFPLYDTISASTLSKHTTELTVEEKNMFLENIQKVKTPDFELFYMLIKMYAHKHKEVDFLPYGGKKLKKGIRFDLGACPPHLQQILYRFLETYLQK